MRPALALLGLALVTALAVPPAEAASSRRCGSIRVDRFLYPSPTGQFGAFRIRARGTGCLRARRVASGYVFKPADPSAPVRIGRWRCTARTIEAQVVAVSCRLRRARVSFRDVLPSG